MQIEVIEVRDNERRDAEQFIHDRFVKAYDADLHNFMPRLVRIHTHDDIDVAILGYRPAQLQALFLERYLDAPIETIISQYTGKAVNRAEIVEVGNLADAYPGGARVAIVALTAYLYGSGYRWVAFTGVPRVLNAFERLGLEPVSITEAKQSSLSNAEKQEWGHYYDTHPQVMFGDINEGYASLDFTMRVLHPLWETALNHGKQRRVDGAV
ncbi:MAG: thermostable hemolysin [Mariprofundales bacterium]